MDIFVLPVRKDSFVTISCPIFYRVIDSESARRLQPLPVCSMRALPELLRKYCGKSIWPSVNFEKTRDWYKGPSLRQGPVYLSENAPRETESSLVPTPGCYRGSRTLSASKELKNSGKENYAQTLERTIPILR